MATTGALGWRSIPRRFGFRLVAAMLLVSVPLMIVLAVLLTTSASSSLTKSAQREGIDVARAVALRVEDWLSERRDNLAVISGTTTERLTGPAAKATLVKIDKTYDDYTLIEIADLTGKVLATSRAGAGINPTGQAWFATAVAGKSAVTSLIRQGDHIQWIIAEPFLDSAGHPRGVVIGNLNPAVLTDMLNPELGHGNQIVVVDTQHQLIYDSKTMGKVTNDSALLTAGALSTTIENIATIVAAVQNETTAATATMAMASSTVAAANGHR